LQGVMALDAGGSASGSWADADEAMTKTARKRIVRTRPLLG
jgi:hypothetical protein